MHYPKANLRLISLAVASACAGFGAPALAQSVSGPVPAADEVQTVVVTGLRQSLQSSMNLKRNSDGIVDGIVAADIGKFPDTNLAESLQRISGVSIDRSIGEGSKITVRGVGPDFNLVLLNGRQMATSSLGDLNGRAFDFANLASEAISQIQVYKSARAETPTGGIGATVNVMTARPLSRPGMQASVGIKAVHDTSVSNLPGDVRGNGKSVTPEVSGIYSNTFAGNTFGVAVTGSYQERDLGFNQAAVPGGWRGPFRGDENNWGSIPQPQADGSTPGIVNRPDPSDIYAVPQNMNYSMNGVRRQRTNAGLTLQYKPVSTLTTTLDYNFSQNKLQTRRADVSAWFNFGPSTSSWTDGPVAAPLVYTEQIPAGNSDIAMGAGRFATKTDNHAVGFNALWRATDTLSLDFDVHKSTAESKADSPFGSSSTLGSASFSRGDSSVDFSQEMPVLSIQGANYAGAPQQVTGSVFQNGYMKGEVEQIQVKGKWDFADASNLKFGIASTEVNNRSAFSTQQRDTWGGATKPADYAASLWHPESLRQYFDKLEGSDNPNLFNQFNTFDFEEVHKVVSSASGLAELYMPKKTWDTDQRTKEKSKSLYVQVNTDWDTAYPIHTSIGVRYEKTDVISTALVPTPTGITWVAANEFSVLKGAANFTTLTGEYKHVLPNFDADIELSKTLKGRFSYGESIGRPRYDQIAGGQIIDNLARVNGGTGSQGNPALKPVKSKNLDLSLEWYYGAQNFASIGYFKKDLKNYAGQSRVTTQPFGLRTPVGGAWWNEALANGCPANDTVCIRSYILANKNGLPGVTRGAAYSPTNPDGSIAAQPNDPLANFEITTFSNQKKADLYGVELNLQHMFGNTGFGISSNATWVRSGLKYDDRGIGEQFALVGLSNSANLVGIYEDAQWTVRAAYNWRDKFLSSTFDGAGPNPNYVEAYGQLDLSVGYNVSDKLSLQLEAINLTDETQRVHGRNERMALYVTQAGPRYMVSARYKF